MKLGLNYLYKRRNYSTGMKRNRAPWTASRTPSWRLQIRETWSCCAPICISCNLAGIASVLLKMAAWRAYLEALRGSRRFRVLNSNNMPIGVQYPAKFWVREPSSGFHWNHSRTFMFRLLFFRFELFLHLLSNKRHISYLLFFSLLKLSRFSDVWPRVLASEFWFANCLSAKVCGTSSLGWPGSDLVLKKKTRFQRILRFFITRQVKGQRKPANHCSVCVSGLSDG